MLIRFSDDIAKKVPDYLPRYQLFVLLTKWSFLLFCCLAQELLYMSDLKNYKANFKTTNKYLKYFCNSAASEWTLKKYQNHFSEKSPEKAKKAFMKNLEIVKNKAKNIPSDVNQHINRLMKPDVDPGTSSSRNVDNITVCEPSFMISYTMFIHFNILFF